MKNLFLLLFTMLSTATQAQTEFRDISFSEALAAAKAEDKMVFIDCYTEWCGPCKRMAKEEFPKKEMGDYLNPRFVNLKIDMEKGEGPELSKRYDVMAFPTYLVLDTEGNVVYRTLAAMKAEKFIAAIDKGINEGGGIVSLQRRYKAGERSEEFIDEYLQALSNAFMLGEVKAVVADKLQGYTAEQIASDEKAFTLIEKYIDEFDAPLFQTIYQHRDILTTAYGERAEKKVADIIFRQPYHFATFDGKAVTAYDYDRLSAFTAQLKADKIAYAPAVDAYFRTYAAQALGNDKDMEKNFKTLVREDVDGQRATEMLTILSYGDKKPLAQKLSPTLISRLEKLRKAEKDAEKQAEIDKNIKRIKAIVGE